LFPAFNLPKNATFKVPVKAHICYAAECIRICYPHLLFFTGPASLDAKSGTSPAHRKQARPQLEKQQEGVF